MRSQIVSVYKVETLNASAYSGEIKSIFPWKLFVGQKQVMNQVVIDSYTFAVSKTILLCFILPFRVCKKLFPVQATLNEAECPEGLRCGCHSWRRGCYCPLTLIHSVFLSLRSAFPQSFSRQKSETALCPLLAENFVMCVGPAFFQLEKNSWRETTGELLQAGSSYGMPSDHTGRRTRNVEVKLSRLKSVAEWCLRRWLLPSVCFFHWVSHCY